METKCIYTYRYISKYISVYIFSFSRIGYMSAVPGLLWEWSDIKLLKTGNFTANPLITTWLSCWDSDCLYNYVNEVRTYDWLAGCVGWNRRASLDSSAFLESIYWLSWKCREVMEPFDLLLPRPMSISESNIDPFKQSDFIEGRPHFLMVKEWDEWWGSDCHPHNKERVRICRCCLKEKGNVLHRDGSSGEQQLLHAAT